MNERVKPEAQKSENIEYYERVLPSFGSFLPTLAVFPTVLLALFPISPLIGFVVGGILAVLAPLLMILLSPTIRVSGGLLQVSKARLPLSVISSVKVIQKSEAFAERGPKLDARAYFVFQASVPELLKVELDDPKDPTPYWLFSSRHANELAQMLTRS